MAVTKIATLDKNQALTLLHNFFNQFQSCCNRSTAATVDDLESVLSEDFHITSNNHLLATSLEEYIETLNQLKKRFKHFELATSNEEPLVNGNRIAVEYELHTSTRDKKEDQFIMMAIATIENNKFVAWTEVSHHKGSGQQWKT